MMFYRTVKYLFEALVLANGCLYPGFMVNEQFYHSLYRPTIRSFCVNGDVVHKCVYKHV